MKRLNIFVDETGEFGFEKGASRLYGVSFTFHEHFSCIDKEIDKLNERLEKIGYTGMIHMADLIMKRGDYEHFNIVKRRSIFKAIYNFSRKIPVKYCSIIVDKKYNDNVKLLRKNLSLEINNMIDRHMDYFKKFDKIVLYYDNGQKFLGMILVRAFISLDSFEHKTDFNHEKKRLFQVSDMLTFIDKYDYKYKHKIKLTKGEKYFFNDNEIKNVLSGLNKKRF